MPIHLKVAVGAALSVLLVTAACSPRSDMRPDMEKSSAASACQALMADSRMDALRPRLIVEAVDLRRVPTQQMLTDAAKPTEAERDAVRVFEENARACKQDYEKSGYRFYAIQDVRDLRISDIRARLHKGEITYGAYNNRYVEILSAYAEQQSRMADAYSRGKAAGDAAEAAFNTQLMLNQQMIQNQQIQNELSAIRSQQTTSQYRLWNCNSSSLGSGLVSVTCY